MKPRTRRQSIKLRKRLAFIVSFALNFPSPYSFTLTSKFTRVQLLQLSRNHLWPPTYSQGILLTYSSACIGSRMKLAPCTACHGAFHDRCQRSSFSPTITTRVTWAYSTMKLANLGRWGFQQCQTLQTFPCARQETSRYVYDRREGNRRLSHDYLPVFHHNTSSFTRCFSSYVSLPAFTSTLVYFLMKYFRLHC